MLLNWRPRNLHVPGPQIITSLTDREAYELRRLSEGKKVLEVGTAHGFSTITMALGASHVTSVDHHRHLPDSYNTLLTNLKSYGVSDKVRAIQGDSKTELPKLFESGERFDLAFIDGDHTTKGVTFDAEWATKLVSPGGVLAFHDDGEDQCPEVGPALSDFFSSNPNQYIRDTLRVIRADTESPPDLSVITLTVPSRAEMLKKLQDELQKQINGRKVEHYIEPGPYKYGDKMRTSNVLSKGRYVCWMDDDDWPMPGYVDKILEGIATDSDVVTFGSYTPPHVPAWLRFGKPDNLRQKGKDDGWIKSANHYCAWKREIALSSPWLVRNYGAEYAWYTALRLGFPDLKEYHIPELLHEYRYSKSGTICQDPKSVGESMSDGRKVKILRHNRTLLYAKGERQPDSKGYYTVQFPDGKTDRVLANQCEILEEINYK